MMAKNTRKKKVSEFGKTNNKNQPDENITNVEDVQQISATSERFKCHAFVNFNMENAVKQKGMKSLENLKYFEEQGIFHIFGFI